MGYSLLPTLLCPSDNITARPASPWAPLNYHANASGPGSISQWSGVIVPGTNPWYNNSNNQGAVGTQSITDGTSNTAMWSECLIGINDPGTGYGNLVLRSDPARFAPCSRFDHAEPRPGSSGRNASPTVALQCANIPGSRRRRAPGTSAATGTWAWPTRFPNNAYTHVNAPEHPQVYLHQQ